MTTRSVIHEESFLILYKQLAALALLFKIPARAFLNDNFSFLITNKLRNGSFNWKHRVFQRGSANKI